MRAALLLRADADSRPGGDVVQARAVAEHLRRRGVDVVESRGWRPDLRGVDVAVVLNLTVPEQAWLHAAACRRAGVPYLLLPVFWDLATAIPQEQAPTGARLLPVGSRRRGAAQRLRLLAGAGSDGLAAAGAGVLGYLSARDLDLVRRVVAGADAVCPSSVAELEHLADHVGVRPGARWRVVHNGLAVAELPGVDELPTEREDVVVSVGAISPRKNSLGLVRAARALDCPVLLVGQLPRPGDAYAARVLAEAPAHVQLLGLLPRAEVLDLLSRSRVHVQPGFVETPGLASLEAVALGAAAVVSDTAPVREYLGSDAWYADPHDSRTLVEALQAARQAGGDLAAATRVRDRYDWEVALAPLDDLLGR